MASRKKPITCKKCGESGLIWIGGQGNWRLGYGMYVDGEWQHDPIRELHVCKEGAQPLPLPDRLPTFDYQSFACPDCKRVITVKADEWVHLDKPVCPLCMQHMDKQVA